MFHFSTKAEQIETQCGGEVWQERERRRERQTGIHILTSSSLASGKIEITPFLSSSFWLISVSDKSSYTNPASYLIPIVCNCKVGFTTYKLQEAPYIPGQYKMQNALFLHCNLNNKKATYSAQ